MTTSALSKMKGFSYICLGLISTLLASCIEDMQLSVEQTAINLSIESAQSKVTSGQVHGASLPLYWETDDRIHVNGHDSEPLTEGGSPNATFFFQTSLASPFNAIYPASAAGSTTEGNTEIILPTIQKFNKVSFDRNSCILLGKGDEAGIRLKHAMAYIAFVIEEGKIDASLISLQITSVAGEKLSGRFTTDHIALHPGTDAQEHVCISSLVPVELGSTFILAIPAQNYTKGFNLTVTDSQGRTMSRTTKNEFKALAGHIYTTTLTFTPADETPDHLYLGGEAMEWAWDLKDERAVIHKVSPGVYMGTFNFDFKENKGFKFWETSDYGGEYGMVTASTYGNIRFDLRNNIKDAPNGDPQFYLESLGYRSGEYTMTIDFNTQEVILSADNGDPGTTSPLSDKNATDKTKKLYTNLMTLAGTGTMFGAQMPTTHGINYTSSWTAETYDTNRSDTKDLTGSHPALCGWEIGHIENDSSINLDGTSFEKIRAHIIAAYERGAVNTISWHCNNPVTDGRYDDTSDNPIQSILPGGSHHDKFLSWLDKAAAFFLSLKSKDNSLIPIIFRPWHEHTDNARGTGFWWSVGNNSNDSYRLLWQMTFEYLTINKGVHNLIWAYSPDLHHMCWNEVGLDKHVYMNAWPGDGYVDILGLDAYHTSYSNFDISAADVVCHAASLAEDKGKLFAITETGLSNNNPGHYKYLHDSSWWTNRLYPLIKDIPVSYVMVWRNDGYPVDGGFPEYFNAFPGSYSTEDFLDFVGKNDILLENDLPSLYQ